MKKNTLGKNAILNGIKTVCSILFPFISFSYCSRVLGADIKMLMVFLEVCL